MEKITFKDVAHFYLGCQAQVRKKDRNKEWLTGRIAEVTRKSNHGDWVDVIFDEVHTIVNAEWQKISSNSHHYFLGYDEIKPILRPLSDITEHERVNAIEPMAYGLNSLKGIELLLQSAEVVKYLLSKHFDLFNLIENGEAIKDEKSDR